MTRPLYSDCVGWQPDRLDVLLLLQEEADDIKLADLRKRIEIFRENMPSLTVKSRLRNQLPI